MTVPEVLGVGTLGGAGAIARFALDGSVGEWTSRAFPYGTLMVNLVGSLILGLLVGAALRGSSLELFGTGFLERVRVCKRDGELLSYPRELPDNDPTGLSMWQKLMVYTSEQARYRGEPLHDRLIRELRSAGASGATCLRGIWGYHGEHKPHGDSFWQLHRRVPVLTIIVDTPARTRTWFAIADRLTQQTGLVTSEMVPAFRATGPRLQQGGLRLAQRLP